MNGNPNDYKPYNPPRIGDPEVYIERANISELFTREALRCAIWAAVNSYSPYSDFPVGAVVTGKGTIFSGCNVENASYGITLCAERSAISTMINESGPSTKIREIIIYTPTVNPSAPCGACRQIIREFQAKLHATMVYSFAADPSTPPLVRTIDQLLPTSFGPENL